MGITAQQETVRPLRELPNVEALAEQEERIALYRRWKDAQARLDGWRDLVERHARKLEREVRAACDAVEAFEEQRKRRRAGRGELPQAVAS